MVDPLKPEYEMPTKSGRKIIIGPIEKSMPKVSNYPMTKRIVNYVGDLNGSLAMRLNSINEYSEVPASGKSTFSPVDNSAYTRNTI